MVLGDHRPSSRIEAPSSPRDRGEARGRFATGLPRCAAVAARPAGVAGGEGPSNRRSNSVGWDSVSGRYIILNPRPYWDRGAIMAQLIVRTLDVRLIGSLKARASRQQRSL